ncbi:MAG: hypothetical protein H7A47_14120 [Verrucomicrobiales bacterium]|nr:hypothetical protein [Verrucomicrobiales bacterium]
MGISAAGEDAENPHIEALPRALEKALNAVPDRSFDVLYYRSDKERKTVSQLMSDLVWSDIMVAFMGRKYLRSEYCMVELLEAATLLQPKDTFRGPQIGPSGCGCCRWLTPRNYWRGRTEMRLVTRKTRATGTRIPTRNGNATG